MNSWRAKISRGPIDTTFLVCHSGHEENYVRSFYLCPQAQIVWSYFFTIIRKLFCGRRNFLPFRPFSFAQCIFGDKVDFRPRSTARI